MPQDGNPPLRDTQVYRIQKSALNSESLAKLKGSNSLDRLMSEVLHMHNRTLNQILFDINLQDPSQRKFFPALKHVRKGVKPVVPPTGTIPVPEYDFKSSFRALKESSFLDVKEVIHALTNVRSECNKFIGLQLFQTEQNKAMEVSEFQKLQTEQTKTTAMALKRAWCEGVRNGINEPLNAFGDEHPMSLSIANRKAYESGKLRRMLACVNFVMEETLRVLTEESLRKFADFFHIATAYKVEVRGTMDVLVSYKHPYNPAIVERPPLFTLELCVVDGVFGYSTDADQFEAEPVALFDQAIRYLHDVPQVESAVLRKMFLGKQKYLKSVHEDSPVATALRDQMKDDLARACKPLRDYVSKFEEFLEFLNLDVSEYMRAYEENEYSLSDDKVQIDKKLAEKRRVVDEIPQFMNLGMFSIKLESISKSLIQKYDMLVHMIMALIAQKASFKCKNVISKFKDIHKRLIVKPTNIEEIAELEDYMKEVPKESEEIRVWIEEMLTQFDVLDEYNFELTDDQFSNKWSAFGWPRQIEATLVACEDQNNADRLAYMDDMKKEQLDFEKKLDELEVIVGNYHTHSDLGKISEIGPDVRSKVKLLKEYTDLSKKFQSRENIFGLDQTDYDRVSRIAKQFDPYAQLWISADDWFTWKREWFENPFDTLDPEKMENSLTEAFRNVFKASKAFTEMPALKDAAEEIKKQIEDFKPVMPIVTALRNPGLKDRHWSIMSKELGTDLIPGENLNSLEDVYTLGLLDKEESITKVCESAGKEYAIESALDKMMKDWAPMKFEIMGYRETGSYVLKGADDIQQMLDDNIVMTQAMGFSPFNKPHKARLDSWAEKLNLMSEIIEQWLNCQRNWMYLEPIFSSDDIMKQLPAEGQKFKACDRQWRKLLKIAFENPICLAFIETPDVLVIFTQSYNTLEQVQKGLSDYLETKRQAFARFYFLSNEELLEILSQTKDPRAVQPHLRKCFEAINKVDFQSDLAMTCMYSGENEKVEWDDKVYPEGNVENWLTEVEKMMRMSISTQLGLSVQDYVQSDRKAWVLRWPGQIVLGCDQIYWSSETEEAIRAKDLKGYHHKCHQQLLDVTKLVRTDLTNLQRVSLGALVTLDVHGRDVVENLCNVGVQEVSDFEWAAQLRYYWLDSPEAFSGTQCAFLVQVENRFRYGCEYLGNTLRLVVTPLTDRIYLTLTGALGMALGGAPAGPAGTGKTETTKDLAKAMAKQCIVFNCQEGMDYIMVGKFFKGLAMSGAWACFDEFNRINVEVLSVIAQQLLTINQAIVNKLERFVFEGVEISLNPENASFITMNPG
jgi:dynein heavy chain, axonemal